MSRVSVGRRAVNVAVSSLLLMGVTLIPSVGAVASSPSTTCSPNTDAPTASAAPAPSATCYLDIRAPSSVRTGVAFQVQVAVTTDSTKSVVATSDPCGSKAPIELDLTGPYNATYFATANAGIATFSITIPNSNPGEYSLFAYGPPFDSESGAPAAPASCANTTFVPDEGPCSEGCSGVAIMAIFIPADSAIAPCPRDTNCVQATSTSGTQATLIADQDGTMWDDKVPGYFETPTISCGTPPADPKGELAFTLMTEPPASPTGVIVLALDRTRVKSPTQTGTGQYNVCWHQTLPFTTAAGTFTTTGDLPNCKQRDQVAPCVVSRTSGQHNVAFLTILTPSNDIDPKLYGH
jgi:hypothetical protein